MEDRHQCPPAELEQIMEMYGKTVYRLAYSQTRSKTDAEDIFQDVFLRYFRKRPEFDSEEHRKAWLLRVTLNQSKSLFRSAWFRHTVPLEDQMVFDEPEERELDEALAQMKSGERKLLHLFYYEGLSVREIGQLLNRKESTVRTQLTRARRHLAEIMKGEAYVSEGI
jgi:RNA polymerase sigma-70 factor (ECF subfamily)